MPRVNISLPDQLHEQLEGIRGGDPTLNISAICQEALSREVARRRPPADLELSDEVLERLRSEKEEYERVSRERGFLMGREWARRAKYQQLRYWGHYQARPPQDLGNVHTPPYEVLDWLQEDDSPLTTRNDVDNVIRANPEFKYAEVQSEFQPRLGVEIFWFQLGDRRSFNEGFLQAVKGFWDQVKERI